MKKPMMCLTKNAKSDYEGFYYVTEDKSSAESRFMDDFPEKTLLGVFETNNLDAAIKMHTGS